MLSSRKAFTFLQRVPPISPIIFTDATFQRVKSTPFPNQLDKYHKIITQYSPHNIDIGKEFKQDDLEKYIHNYNTSQKIKVPTIYRFINHPDEISGPSHYSFMTSLMTKNKNSIMERKRELREIDRLVSSHKRLYITDISKDELDYAIHEICQYHYQYQFDELCLYDICRRLSFEEFEYLIQTICLFGVPKSKIGLKITGKKSSEFEDIIRYALQNNIRRYTVELDE